MNSVKQQLNNNEIFFVTKNGFQRNLDLEALTELYLPVLGTTAFSLYIKFFNLKSNEIHNHLDLIENLHINVDSFSKQKARLEAVSLLNSYQMERESKPLYRYELIPPMSFASFFQDQLMSSLLYREIGQANFEQIKKRFIKTYQEGLNVSASFSEVFGQSPLIQTHQIQKIKNYSLIQNRIVSSGVSQNEFSRHLKLIDSLREVYGYSDEEIATFMVDAIQISTHEIDPDLVIVNALKQTKSAEVSKHHQNSTTSNTDELDSNQKALVEDAQQFDNYQFLTLLKQIYNGYPTSGEQKTLLKLAELGLSKSVINIVTYNAINSSEIHSLNKNFAESTADLLSQNGATKDPVKAVVTIKNSKLKRNKVASNKKVVTGVDYKKPMEVDTDEIAKLRAQIKKS